MVTQRWSLPVGANRLLWLAHGLLEGLRNASY